MSFPVDNTGVIRMKRDFDQYLKDQNESTRPLFSLDDYTTHGTSFREEREAVSVQSLLDKERAFKAMRIKETESQCEIHKLEMKINSLETNLKKQKLDHEQEIGMLQMGHSKDRQKVADLESQLKVFKDKQEQLLRQQSTHQAETDQQRKKYDEQILSLQKKKTQLADDLQQEKDTSWLKTKELKSDLMRKETELKICQLDLEETKVQMKQQQQRSSDLSNKMTDYEENMMKLTQAEQKIKELESQLSKVEEDRVISSGLKSQLMTFQEQERETRKLLDENQYLRDTQENNELLKEQLESLRKRNERLEEKLTEYNKVLADNEELTSRLEKWENSSLSGSKLKSPTHLSQRLMELQNSEAIMLSKQGELQTNLHVKEKQLHKYQEELRSLQQKVVEGKSKLQQQSDIMKRLQRKLLLVTKERDSYKSMVEMEMTPSKAESSRRSQVQQLEESVRNYQQQADHLETELLKVNEELTVARQQAKQFEIRLLDAQRFQNGQHSSDGDQMTILNLREKIANLEKSLETCEAEKYTLECRIEQRHLQGDYNPTQLKVLHFKMNPAEIAANQKEKELTSLREENERLKQRVKLLEENDGKIEDLTVVVEQKLREPGSSKDIEEIREQLKTAELKNQRLLEIFKKTSQEIREICYQLTGYKIDIHSPRNDQYRLTSMYAESVNDFLLFEQNSTGDIRLLGTEFSETLTDLIEVHLGQQNSIPVFLSSLTVDLFNRQTMSFG